MQNEMIFCFGRPIIDITASIKERFLHKIGINEKSSGKISMNRMELLLKQLSREADHILVSAGGVECNMAINSAILGIPSTFVGAIGDDYFHLIFKDSLGFVEKLNLCLIPATNPINSAIIAVIWITNEDGEKKRSK